MKTVNVISILKLTMLVILFQSCQKNEVEPVDENKNIMPERFAVDIPSSISSYSYYKDSNVDTLQGNDIYNLMRTFIYVGEGAADIVGDIILAIRLYNLNQPISFSFTSEDDGRLKQMDIAENVVFENYSWQYKMTITEIGQDANENTAMQIFRGKNPIKGVAILKPYNIDRNTVPIFMETMYRIDYSETGEYGILIT